ncbi:MAG: creatininase family protein [Candidatus Bathyarchaeota archaeon]|jgi:creatinine amidohydrolase
MLHHKSWVTISEELEGSTIIVPLGSMEVHGAHKPVGCCYLLAEAASEEVSHRTGIPITPVVPFGVSPPYKHFPGTVTVSMEALRRYIYEVSESLARSGFRKILFFSAHGGNNLPVLREVSFRLREEHGILCAVVHVWGLIQKLTPQDFWEPGQRLGHGGEPTTSVMLHLHPELVDMSRAESKPLIQPLEGFKTRSYGSHWFQGVPHSIYLFGEEVQPMGFMGDPTKASVEKGKILYERAMEHLVGFVEAFKKLDLEP